MLAAIDNAFVVEKMFGPDADIFDHAILCDLTLGFGSNIPVSPHPQNILLWCCFFLLIIASWNSEILVYF